MSLCILIFQDVIVIPMMLLTPFLADMTEGNKQSAKRLRFFLLSAFFNFIKNSIDPGFYNPCDTPILRKIFKDAKPNHWKILEVVKKASKMVGINLRPHDLRRHAATYASRSGTPIEIVSKVILRHANLSTTQRYLGKVSDLEGI